MEKVEQKTLRDFIKFIDDCGYDEHPETGHMNIDTWADVLKKWIERGNLKDELGKLGYRKVNVGKLQRILGVGLNRALQIINEVEEVK